MPPTESKQTEPRAAVVVGSGGTRGSIQPGMMIGEYRVEGEIGEGAMGVVYGAIHPLIGKRVAVKVLKSKVAAQKELVERFVREARSVNQICHPNIIDVFAFGQLPDGRHYYVMEYLEGESLDDRLEQRGLLPLAEALPIFRQVADAVDAAHDRDVIHRDLKPDNIFLAAARDGAPRVKILDFGVAKLASAEGAGSTQSGMMIGTPLFMSPEQCRGLQVDRRTDVYAFGVVVYRTLVGRYPIDGDSVAEIIFQQLQEVPQPPSNFGAPVELDAVLGRALEKDPDKRQQRLGELVAELDRIAGRVSPEEPHRFAREGQDWGPGTAPVVIADAGCERGGANDSSAALLPDALGWSTARLEAERPRVCEGHCGGVLQLAFAPSGSLLASASEDHTIRLWDRSGRELAVLRGHQDRVHEVVFSPQGHLVASGSADGTARLWSIFEHSAVRVIEHEAKVTCVRFTADGNLLASAGCDNAVRLCDVTTGEVRLLRGHGAPVRALACSPSSKVIASGSDDRTVRIWSDGSGARRILRGHNRAISWLAFTSDGDRLASASQDGTVREWQITSGSSRTYKSLYGTVRHVEYSPDANLLAAAGSDRRVLVWRRGSSRPIVLEGHEKRIRHLCFSPDGKRLASTSSDGTVRVWNIASGRCDSIVPHSSPARSAQFSPDGMWLATASGSAQVLLTPLPQNTHPGGRATQAGQSSASIPLAKSVVGQFAVVLAVVALITALALLAFLV